MTSTMEIIIIKRRYEQDVCNYMGIHLLSVWVISQPDTRKNFPSLKIFLLIIFGIFTHVYSQNILIFIFFLRCKYSERKI